jgi:hypothetical protein
MTTDTDKLKEECDALLLAMIGNSELVEQWWTTANRGFGMTCPVDAELTKVLDYLRLHAYGGW